MANESLDNSTVIVELEIPQTLQEQLLTTSVIQSFDIPQTLLESEDTISLIKQLDISSTLDEKYGSLTVVVGQGEGFKKNILTSDKISLDNQISSNEIWVEHGIPHVIIQKNVDNNQNVT